MTWSDGRQRLAAAGAHVAILPARERKAVVVARDANCTMRRCTMRGCTPSSGSGAPVGTPAQLNGAIGSVSAHVRDRFLRSAKSAI